MALGTPVAAAAAYSAASGTTVAPAYPTGILTTDSVILFVGMKPTAVGGGTVTTPTGWTLQDSLTNAGGYTAQGADTGNTNLYVYTWNAPVAGQTGNLTVTIGGNNITWAFMVRVPTGGGTLSYGSADGQRTTTPTSPMAIALTNGATATNFEAGDKAIWAMCIPTDVTTPAQFSAQAVTATGAVFATATEINEPDSTLGNDVGGYSAYAHVNSGSSTTAPTVTVTLAGTLTNVRGPVVLLRVREAAAPPAQTLTPTLYTNTQTFFAPTVTRGAVNLLPSLYTNTQTFFSADVTQAGGGQSLTPSLYTNTQTFFSATVTAVKALTPSLYTNTQSYFAPTVSTTYSLTPSLYTNAQIFYSPTVSATKTLTPSLYTNAQTFFAASVVQSGGPQTVLPDLYTNAQTFYAPVVTRGAVALLPSLYSNAQTFYQPTVTPGAVTLAPALYTNTQTFYSPVVSQNSPQNIQYLECLDYVDSGYVEPDWYVAWSAFNTQTFFGPTIAQFAQRGEGWIQYPTQKIRNRSFRREREDRDGLRATIQQAISPLVATEAKVVTVGKKVAVITEGGTLVAIPVPPAFDAKAVSIMVASMLEKAGIEAQRVRSAAIRKQALIVLQQISDENARRLRKQRRDAELLLFM